MLQVLQYMFPLLLMMCYFTNSMMSLWLVGEIMNLLACYLFVKNSKETSVSDLMQYIFILLGMSVVLLIGITESNTILIFIGLWGKLGMVPLHMPMVNMVSKVHPSIIVSFFIIPKLPYFLMGSQISPSMVMFPIMAFMLLFTRTLTNKEKLGITLSVSSMTLFMIFSIDITMGGFLFGLTLIWGLGIGYLAITGNPSAYNLETGVLMNMMLPIPGGYSWLAKVIVTQMGPLSFMSMVLFAIMSSLPAFFIMSFFFKHFNSSYTSMKATSFKWSFVIVYLVGVMGIFM
uniref:NADH dehydrogenase subunit 2 n=1 Tax=Salpa fusiformis TaxID=942554 RepID=A0A2Z5U2Z2_9UROC|nr:NADH dehydrogenase subunit 2 [Salpa fusiformis]